MPKECQGLAVQTPRGPDAHVVDDVSDFDDFESASGQSSALLSARRVGVGGQGTALKQSKGGGGVRNMFAYTSQPATQSTQGGKPKGGSRRRGEAGGSVQSSQAIRGSHAPPLRQRMGRLPCMESTAQKQTTTSVDEIADFSDDEMVGAPTPCTIMSTGEDGSKKDCSRDGSGGKELEVASPARHLDGDGGQIMEEWGRIEVGAGVTSGLPSLPASSGGCGASIPLSQAAGRTPGRSIFKQMCAMAQVRDIQCPYLYTCSECVCSFTTHALSLFFSLSHTHTHSLSLSLSLTHTHTHTARSLGCCPRDRSS